MRANSEISEKMGVWSPQMTCLIHSSLREGKILRKQQMLAGI